MKHKVAVITLVIYSILIAVGGIMGYVKVQSLASLISGLAFGIAIGINAIGIGKGCHIAGIIATALTGFLGLFFAYRFYHSFALMPAGLMMALSVVTLAILIKYGVYRKSTQTP